MSGPLPRPASDGPIDRLASDVAAGLLRRAADHLDRLADGVPGGPWSTRGLLATRPEIVAEDEAGTEHVAEARARSARWIVTMSPDLAAPLVAWLRATAADLDRAGSAAAPTTTAAVALARTLLAPGAPASDAAPPNVHDRGGGPNGGRTVQKLSLDAVARRALAHATDSTSGRAAETVYGGHEHALRQTLIALTSGSSLAEHSSPGEATLEVRSGRVRLLAGDDSWDGRSGDLLILPAAPHTLEALETSVVLLTVAKR